MNENDFLVFDFIIKKYEIKSNIIKIILNFIFFKII